MNSFETKERLRTIATLPLNAISDIVHENAVNHGFHPKDQSEWDWFAHMCNNKHGEISEMYEAGRSGNLRKPCDKAEKMAALGLPPLTCIEEEMADLIIRCLDESARLGIDIGKAVAAKHLYNLTRPFKHGRLS